jgi:lysophospholipase L1-like esterase
MSCASVMDNISCRRLYHYVYFLYETLTVLTIIVLIFCFVSFSSAQPAKWVGTWSTAPQLVEPGNNPPSPGLSDNTLRQIVRVSLGGDILRMRFSNEFSTGFVTLNEVHMALSAGRDTIDPVTDAVLLFNGQTSVTIEPGSAITSDPLQFALPPRADVAITMYFGSTSVDVTGHPGSRTTSYLLTGNEVSRENFYGAVTTDHWYMINTIEVLAPDSAHAVAVLGNSITDGRGSGTNKQNRWPDELARRLQENPATQLVAVLNEGIGGNCVLGSCLGPSALSRFERDVLNQKGVKWLIILEGINDIGYGAAGVGNNLIEAYRQMIYSAHAHGIFVYGATLLPFGNSFYYSEAHEFERQTVNEWIRNGGLFDAVIDFDRALRNPADTLSLLPEADTGDHLHPSETGHRLMAEAVDLSLFAGNDSLIFDDDRLAIYFEPECAIVGEDWEISSDPQASNGHYVTAKPGMQSLNQPPLDSAGAIIIPFSVDSAGNYSVFGRLNNPSYDDDSFWVKMDDGEFGLNNGLVTRGWEWKKFNGYVLAAGEHTLSIAYREDGAGLDKICISNYDVAPLGLGGEAENLCSITGVENSMQYPVGYALEQNYPNPFNPTTSIKYYLPRKSKVILEVLDITGSIIETIINNIESIGEHTVVFNGSGLSSGIYFYRIRASTGFMQSKKMVLIK